MTVRRKAVMHHDNASTNSDLIALSPQTLYRGLYVRVARQLGVDPSYVSRVARGERQSPEVESALGQEIGQISSRLRTGGASLNKRSRREQRHKRLGFFVGQRKSLLRREWLRYTEADPNIRRIELSTRRRLEPVIPIVDEALNSMKFSLKEIATKPMKAARYHGEQRRKQGYTPTTLLEEYNLIRRCIYHVAAQNLARLDPQTLIDDLGQLGEVLDFQSQNAIRGFLGHA